MFRLFPKGEAFHSFALFFLFFVGIFPLCGDVILGIDRLFEADYRPLITGKRVGLLTHAAAVNKRMQRGADVLEQGQKKGGYTLAAFFTPEHGFWGSVHANVDVEGAVHPNGIPIFSLHGTHKRPSKEMLATIDTLIIDIQDIGSRSYSYMNTAFMAMEEAAKEKIKVIVCDRPNPMGGEVIDGPMLEQGIRSAVGYCSVPLCHGMTFGELALYFNKEEKIGCDLQVIPMKGWTREMSFVQTGLKWVPTSPYIPEAHSPFYYATTGILGELKLVNIGIGYTMPFRMVGAPWIDGERFAEKLREQKLPGVFFHPVRYRPFYGRHAKQECKGVLLFVTDHTLYLPVKTQWTVIGLLKSLYPKQFALSISQLQPRKQFLSKVTGRRDFLDLLQSDGWLTWKLIALDEEKRREFVQKRARYLLY